MYWAVTDDQGVSAFVCPGHAIPYKPFSQAWKVREVMILLADADAYIGSGVVRAPAVSKLPSKLYLDIAYSTEYFYLHSWRVF